MPEQDSPNAVLSNGVKLLGEAVLPGASELLENRFGRGVAVAGVGVGVPLLLAPVMGPVAGPIVGTTLGLLARGFSFWDSLSPTGTNLGRLGDPLRVLERRYANGEIDTADFEERRRTLLGGQPSSGESRRSSSRGGAASAAE